MARARHVQIIGDKTVMIEGRLITDRPADAAERVFLGLDGEGNSWSAGSSAATSNLHDLRSLALEAALPPDLIGILAQARSLVNWHERHGFCANCGAQTRMQDAGYRRHCGACLADHFPRTDPVIIIVAVNRERILLGRQKLWAPGMFSALAGFMEPGETIEDAARREVFEEAGIRVGAIRYAASQPWPFPSSLMIGLIGEATGEAIQIDANEIEDARWFSFAEAQMMIDRTHPHGLWATHPFAIAHLLVREALQSS